MSLELTITATDGVDLRNQLQALLGVTDIPAAPVSTNPQSSSPKASAQRAAPKAETQASAPSPEPSATSPTTQSEATTTEADGGADTASPSDDAGEAAALDYERDIKPAVLKVSAKGGRPAVEKLLSQFDAANAKEIPTARWPELLAEIDKILA